MKRTVGKRTAAVLTIIQGSLYALAGIFLVTAIGFLTAVLSPTDPEYAELSAAMSNLSLMSYGILAFGVASIVLGSLFCQNKTQKGIAIAIIVAQVLILILDIVSMTIMKSEAVQNSEFNTSFSAGWLGYAMMALIVVFSVIHIIKAPKAETAPAALAPTPAPGTPAM